MELTTTKNVTIKSNSSSAEVNAVKAVHLTAKHSFCSLLSLTHSVVFLSCRHCRKQSAVIYSATIQSSSQSNMHSKTHTTCYFQQCYKSRRVTSNGTKIKQQSCTADNESFSLSSQNLFPHSVFITHQINSDHKTWILSSMRHGQIWGSPSELNRHEQQQPASVSYINTYISVLIALTDTAICLSDVGILICCMMGQVTFVLVKLWRWITTHCHLSLFNDTWSQEGHSVSCVTILVACKSS